MERIVGYSGVNHQRIIKDMTMHTLHIKTYARLTGFAYFLLIPFGVFGIMYIPTLTVEGDFLGTITNISDNAQMFKFSMAAAVATQLIHILVGLMLFKIFAPVNRNAAKLLVIFALLPVPIALLNEINHGAVLVVLANSELSNSLAELFMGLHAHGIMIAGVFWGLWLFPMGYLVFKSGFVPKIIGIALMIGCFGYVIDSFLFILAPDFGFQFAQFLFVGELMITFWLLIVGVNEDNWPG